MQENNFEKNVRQKLDELHLTPSEPVWQKVEAAIKKKRERRLLFWLLPVLMLTSGLVWWQMAAHPVKDVAQQATPQTSPASIPTFSKPHIEQSRQKTGTVVLKQKTKVATINPPVFTAAAKKKSAAIATKKEQQQGDKQTAVRELSKNTTSNRNNAVPFTTKAIEKTSAIPANNVTQRTTTETKSAVALHTDTLQKIKTAKTDSIAAAFQQPIKKNRRQKRLQWSIASRVGISNAIEKLFSGIGMKSYQQSYPNMSYYPGGILNSGYSSDYDSTGYRQSATPTKGMHFSIGVLAKKSIGKSSFLLAGLQYSFYSTHLKVGTELSADSANGTTLSDARKVFRNDARQNQVTNAFHYIEVPIGLEYQLFKKVPLHVQHGVTITELVASKALQYDYATNRYYQRSAALQKTGLSFFTGIDYTIWHGKTLSLQAGPHLQYALHPLFKNTSGSHLFSGSLAVYMSF